MHILNVLFYPHTFISSQVCPLRQRQRTFLYQCAVWIQPPSLNQKASIMRAQSRPNNRSASTYSVYNIKIYIRLKRSKWCISRKKTSFSKLPAIAIDSERTPLVPQSQETTKGTADFSSSPLPSVLKHTTDDSGHRRSRASILGKESEPLLAERSPDSRSDTGKTNVEFVPEIVEEGDAIILEETEIPRHGKLIRSKEDRRSRLPTPPPTKNVSFGELHEQNYLEQAILPPPSQFVPKHRHSGEIIYTITLLYL